jgi:hypothetical protein
MDFISRTPPRGTLMNLENQEIFEFQFNPTTLEESIRVRYSRINVPGLSHQRLQYDGTANMTIPLELFMSQLAQDLQQNAQGTTPHVAGSRKKFLQALAYPIAIGQAPPQVLFIWPRMVSIVAVVTRITFQHKRFSSRTAATTELIARLDLEEDRDMAIRMEEIRRQGSYHPTEDRNDPTGEAT